LKTKKALNTSKFDIKSKFKNIISSATNLKS